MRPNPTAGAPRAPGFLIPVIDDPEGHMFELFLAVAHIEVPPGTLCPKDRASEVLAAVKAQFARAVGPLKPGETVPLLLGPP
jgi:hypothetical protein